MRRRQRSPPPEEQVKEEEEEEKLAVSPRRALHCMRQNAAHFPPIMGYHVTGHARSQLH